MLAKLKKKFWIFQFTERKIGKNLERKIGWKTLAQNRKRTTTTCASAFTTVLSPHLNKILPLRSGTKKKLQNPRQHMRIYDHLH